MTDKTENKEEKLKEEIENYKETIDILHRNIDELEAGKQEAYKEEIKFLEDKPDAIKGLNDFVTNESVKKCGGDLVGVLKERLQALKSKLQEIN